MPTLLDPEIPVNKMAAALAASQVDGEAKAGATARSIRTIKRGSQYFTDVPHSVYFYYIRVNKSGRLEVSHYFHPNINPGENPDDHSKWKPIDHTDAALRPIITMLAENARPIRKPKPKEDKRERKPPRGRQRFEAIEWKHKSYIVFFVDEVNWKFHKPPKSDPVVFITEEKDNKYGNPNWSFFDALDFEIDMPISGSTNKDKRTALAFINHMKVNDTGRDIGRDMQGKPLPKPEPPQLFQFQLYLEVFFANGTSKMTVILDPDGNNMGPPIGPP